MTIPRLPELSVWKKAWDAVLKPVDNEHQNERLRDTFIDWLCADLIRAQTWRWLPPAASEANLMDTLKKTKSRHPESSETIAETATRLYKTLLQSKSSRAVLKKAEGDPERLPGANGTSRVLGVCEPSGIDKEKLLFIHNQQPDTVISVFNSPFGPDVLVVTDKLSEGIDLHRYCRHLIHYELDPSPIRTVHTSINPDFRRDFPLAMQWIAERRVDVNPLVTHTYKLSEIQTAFETFRDRREGAIKVFVEFPSYRKSTSRGHD